MSVSFFVFAIIIISLANAQANAECDNNSNVPNSYDKISSCLRKYKDLQSYVLNDDDLLDNLTEVFFKTGKVLTRFVKITYKFQILLPVDNSTNSTNDVTLYYGNDSSEVSCIDKQKMFIWSSSALYLLGPKPLFWLTLFAVFVPETSITIQLPCLCSDAYDDLLSRLTYLIRVYPAMQFEGETIQFISTHYFETKARDEDKYKSIVKIFGVSIYFTWATFAVFQYLAFMCSKKIADRTTTFLNDKNIPKNPQHATDMRRDKLDKRIMIFAISFASILLSLALLTFQVVASIKLIQYGNEVLYDDNDDYDSTDISNSKDEGIITENKDHGYNLGNDDQCVPIVYVVFSFLPTALLFLALFIRTIRICRNYDKDVDQTLGAFLQLSLRIFLVYLGFYFLPYMLLAFINDPIQSAFIYLMGASFIFCVYLFTYTVFMYVRIVRLKVKLSSLDFRSKLVHVSFTWASTVSIAYFLIILIFIITLGNFHDFQAVENLTIPIIIALLTLFVFKPSYNFLKTNLEENGTNDSHGHSEAPSSEENGNVNQDGDSSL